MNEDEIPLLATKHNSTLKTSETTTSESSSIDNISQVEESYFIKHINGTKMTFKDNTNRHSGSKSRTPINDFHETA